MKICMISDTHEQHDQVVIPECDVLLHAGDMTGRGALGKLDAVNNWFAGLLGDGTVGDIAFIAGNHDLSLEDEPEAAEAIMKAGNYLNESMAYVGLDKSLCVYGVPHQLRFRDWAFNSDEEQLVKIFDKIPGEVEVLITHGPPYGVLDQNSQGIKCGSHALLDWIKAAQPRVVVCGHIHESWGTALVGNTLVVNASVCTSSYKPTNQPIVLEL